MTYCRLLVSKRANVLCVFAALAFSSCGGLSGEKDEELVTWSNAFRPTGKPPAPGDRPEDTARALYSNETFFGVRGNLSKAGTEHLGACFTPSLLRRFAAQRREINEWFRKHRGENLKLPLGEGPVFLSGYEHPQQFQLGKPKMIGDRAFVPVQLTALYHGELDLVTDEALFVRRAGKWLLDDIHFGYAGTLRKAIKLKD
jgi:hypothetical protein